MSQDLRRVENLVNLKPESIQYVDIWLTFYLNPFINKERNIILIEFEKPISIVLINIYNYLKDFRRATKEIEIFLDNYLIYSGHLNHPQTSPLSSILFGSFSK